MAGLDVENMTSVCTGADTAGLYEEHMRSVHAGRRHRGPPVRCTQGCARREKAQRASCTVHAERVCTQGEGTEACTKNL